MFSIRIGSGRLFCTRIVRWPWFIAMLVTPTDFEATLALTVCLFTPPPILGIPPMTPTTIGAMIMTTAKIIRYSVAVWLRRMESLPEKLPY
jgi:hypothetical protein